MVNSSDVCSGKTLSTTGANVAYLSAKDFGRYVEDKSKTSTTSQIIVKLFETVNGAASNAGTATSLYWQAVYRSMDANDDVLTLYMCRPYATNIFDDALGYYAASDVRNNTILGLYNTLSTSSLFKDMFDNYVVAPSNIPGLWQSSIAQTGTSEDLGSSSYTAGISSTGSSTFAINNGLDGWTNTTIYNGETQKVLDTTWTASAQNPYDDKLWIPSSYEVMYKDSSTDGAISYVTNASNVAIDLSNATSGGADNINDGRSGLWELNGYDRVNGVWSFLRSGCSDRSDYVRAVAPNGSSENLYADSEKSYGVRLALHIDLKQLANHYLSQITANQKAADGALSSITAIVPSITNSSQVTIASHDNNYANYMPQNSQSDKFKREITFESVDTSQYVVKSFTLTSGSATKTINVAGTFGSGVRTNANGICDYSYNYEDGELKVTVSNLSGETLNVQANVDDCASINLQVKINVPNSLLMLTFLDANGKLGEFGFAYSSATQTVSMSLPQDATIKILATKPFGSRTEFELDGTELVSTDGVSYQVQTNYTSSKTLVVTLNSSGSGGGFSGNNFIIV